MQSDGATVAEYLAGLPADRRAGGADVFEAGGGGQIERLAQFAYQLPAVEGVEQVDEAGTAVQDLNGQFALRHKEARRLLVGVHTVAE